FGLKAGIGRPPVDPAAIAPALRRELAALDPELPFAEVRTMGEILAGETADGRFGWLLLAGFAAAGVALAVVGVYGVVAHSVSQRRREIATRIVLGAPRRSVMAFVAREGLAAGGLGIILGLAGAPPLAPGASPLLYAVSPRD